MPVKKKGSERGSLLEYFAGKLKMPIKRVAFHLTGFTVQDMYYIRSECDQAENRGIAWGAAFWNSLKVKI